MSEYLTQVGRRAQLRETALKLKIQADSHRTSLRQLLDPLAEPADLPAGQILALAGLLAEVVTELKETEAKIKAVGEIIGA